MQMRPAFRLLLALHERTRGTIGLAKPQTCAGFSVGNISAIAMALFLDRFTPVFGRRQALEALRLAAEVDEFKGAWQWTRETHLKDLATLVADSAVEAIGSALRLDGIPVSDADVRRIVTEHRGAARTREEGAVVGYAALRESIIEEHASITVTMGTIDQMHAIMIGPAPDAERRMAMHWRAAPTAEQTVARRRLTDLTKEYTQLDEAAIIHPLVSIAQFVANFLVGGGGLYGDAVGRLGRALLLLLLIQHGYGFIPYVSLERVIEDHTTEYYLSLRASNAAHRRQSPCGDWLVFLLRCIREQTRRLAAQLGTPTPAMQLTPLQQRIFDAAVSHRHITASELAEWLDVPTRTVRHHLAILTQRELLVAHGERRGRYYTLRQVGE